MHTSLFSHLKLFLFFSLSLIATISNAHQAELVLIIDDIGYSKTLGKRAIELPGAITYAIIPHTPAAKELAYHTKYIDYRKEIIVHMPMQAANNPKADIALKKERGLIAKYNKPVFKNILEAAIKDIPFARGLSNHMGSGLTTMPEKMTWLMESLKEKNYYFVDSRTTTLSAARNAANNNQVSYLERDIFLDSDPSPEAIAHYFALAVKQAKEEGLAIVIAHPYQTTLNFLEAQLPLLEQQGIKLISATEAVYKKQQLASKH